MLTKWRVELILLYGNKSSGLNADGEFGEQHINWVVKCRDSELRIFRFGYDATYVHTESVGIIYVWRIALIVV